MCQALIKNKNWAPCHGLVVLAVGNLPFRGDYPTY